MGEAIRRLRVIGPFLLQNLHVFFIFLHMGFGIYFPRLLHAQYLAHQPLVVQGKLPTLIFLHEGHAFLSLLDVLGISRSSSLLIVGIPSRYL